MQVLEDEKDESTPLLAPANGVPKLIDSEEEFESAIRAITNSAGPIALDAERASGYRYSARAYLIQIKRGEEIHLIDPIPFTSSKIIEKLNSTIQNQEIILHASTQDLPCLREWGLYPNKLFDTELGARLAGLPKVGLGSLVENFFNLTLAKEHSAVDWSKRPLEEAWINYAALDVELLIEIRNLVLDLLEKQGKLDWALQEFESILKSDIQLPKEDPWRRTSGMHKIRSREHLAVVRELWLTRDEIASSQDIAPGKLLSDNAITELALYSPKNAKLFKEHLKPIGYKARWMENIENWLAAILRAQISELPLMRLTGDGMPPLKNWRDKFPKRYELLVNAREALGQVATELALPLENLLTPEVLRRVIWDEIAPTDLEESLHKLGARKWQIENSLPTLLEALSKTCTDK